MRKTSLIIFLYNIIERDGILVLSDKIKRKKYYRTKMKRKIDKYSSTFKQFRNIN